MCGKVNRNYGNDSNYLHCVYDIVLNVSVCLQVTAALSPIAWTAVYFSIELKT